MPTSLGVLRGRLHAQLDVKVRSCDAIQYLCRKVIDGTVHCRITLDLQPWIRTDGRYRLLEVRSPFWDQMLVLLADTERHGWWLLRGEHVPATALHHRGHCVYVDFRAVGRDGHDREVRVDEQSHAVRLSHRLPHLLEDRMEPERGLHIAVLPHVHQRGPRTRHGGATSRALHRRSNIDAGPVGDGEPRETAQLWIPEGDHGGALGGEAVLVHID
mmetsp:Transcript_35620/g.88626  ORF Transcript_35620/g.88626 Transcript_35620/m.88626 type:complete len:215 (+) Transcript_35620:300-944(+)